MSVWTAIGLLVLAIWVYLLVARGGFWLARERDDEVLAAPARWPAVVAVVPARNEADVIARSIGSLLRQDYAGPFRVVLVDDGSSDGTAAVAKTLDGGRRLDVVSGSELPAGWTGKLWALEQGIRYADAHGYAVDYFLLTDADIGHAPDHLSTLVTRASAGCKAFAASGMASAKASCASNTRPGCVTDWALPSSTSPTRASIVASRANQPQVSKPGASGQTPSREIRPCVGRMP